MIIFRNKFFWLTLLVGLITVAPQVVYQPFLLQGDHGRDLYLFQQVAHGAVPYRDIATDNGPLMPYYYAFFLNTFGESVQSTLLGYALLILLTGLLMFFIARRAISEGWAFLCAFWYWAWRGQEFFYTFNHIGALVLGLSTLYFTLAFLENRRRRYIFYALIGSLGCILIRPDIGLAALAAFIICYLAQKPNQTALRFWSLLAVWGGAGIALAVMRFYCPGLLGRYIASAHLHLILPNLVHFCHERWIFLTQNLLIGGIFCLMALLCVTGLVTLFHNRDTITAQKLARQMICTVIFVSFFFMEYLLGTRFFRWIWIMPMSFLMMFYGVSASFSLLSDVMKRLCAAVMIGVCLIMIALNYMDALAAKEAGSILDVGKTQVALAPAQCDWIRTVENASTVIMQHTPVNATILTIPYDALYGFLTHRRLALKDSALFHADSDALIQAIQSQDVNIILISNRAFRHNEQERFGLFGKTYGEKAWYYIQKNYVLISQIGPWDQMATALTHHAVRIYMRKPSTGEHTPVCPVIPPDNDPIEEGIRKDLEQNLNFSSKI